MLAAGEKLGPYEILDLIGQGGMGEVYRARDPRIQREVAVKVCAQQFSERFEREARVIASLNHPNICTLFDVGPNYLVMEYIEGPTLAERIKQGAIPQEESLDIARQIAAALEEAHGKLVVHRDLKPGNVKIRPDGMVKVLDFGLAKAMVEEKVSPEETRTLGQTEVGVILGTPAYMSPEQARGQKVDKRTDIFAFGAVLYEMVTGQRLFKGETAIDTLSQVVNVEPNWQPVPEQLQPLLRRCLEKDVRKRLRDISGMELLLEQRGAGLQPAAELEPGSASYGWSALAATLLIALASLAFIHFREPKPTEPQVLRTTILPPPGTEFDFRNGVGLPAVSPDGKKIVFGAHTADAKYPLWVRPLDGLTAQPLAGTEGATFPFWSPDSRFIAFFADSKLKKIDASGGPVLTLAEAVQGRGGSWGRNGDIIFAPRNLQGPLLRVSSAGGAASSVSKEVGSLPFFLPDGKHFLFQNQSFTEGYGFRAGAVDGSPSKQLGFATTNVVYSQGRLLFVLQGTLMAQPFDPDRLVTTGEALPVAEHVQMVLGTGRAAALSVSETGLLIYSPGTSDVGFTLAWFDRSGKKGARLSDPALIANLRLSPDQKSVAAVVGNQSGQNIWIYDVARPGLRTRLTFGTGVDTDPVWSPDGRTIVFGSNRKGHYDLYRKAADGSGTEDVLYSDEVDKFPSSWSPDGKFILYSRPGMESGTNTWALPVQPEQPGGSLKPVQVVEGKPLATEAAFSPDGHWIAYMATESGRPEVYAAPFPATASGQGGKRQVSATGGTRPVWRGNEIFYLGPNGLMAAEVTERAGAIAVGAARLLFGPVNSTSNSFGDVSADGQRILLRDSPTDQRTEPLVLIQNWTAALKK